MKNKILLIICSFNLALFTPAHAQESASQDKDELHFSFGFKGAGIAADDAYIGAGLELNVFQGDLVYSLHLIRGGEVVIFSDKEPSLLTNTSALFGQQTTLARFFNVQYQVGVGVMNINKSQSCGDFDDCSSPKFRDQRLFGVAAQLGLNLVLSDHALLGLDLQSNVNLDAPLLAVMINLELGSYLRGASEPS